MPSTPALFEAVEDLLSSGSTPFKGTARRYSLCAADAEDAYQRSLEILITKAPTTERSELRPWLHTVIKHEALAIRRQRERLLAGGDEPPESRLEATPGPEEGAPERERLRRSAEALGHLKSSETQCLLLKALGYSYDEIAARTGFSWTKVNRSLTEGRRSFLDRYGKIQSGEQCARFEPLLSAACDGEVCDEDERRLKEHLRSCASCRAALRGFRSVPARLAQLLPPTILLPVLQRGSWWSRLHDSFSAAAGDRVAVASYKLQQVGEIVGAQKATAVVATTAALAGGAVAQERVAHHQHHRARAEAAARVKAVESTPTPLPIASPPGPAAGTAPDPTHAGEGAEGGAQPAGEAPDTAAAGGEFSLEGPGSAPPSASASRPIDSPPKTSRAHAEPPDRVTPSTTASEFGP